MTIFDTITGFFGGQEGSDALADALRSAQARTGDVGETIRSDLSPFLGTGTSANNALQQVFFGTPASPGTVSGATPAFDVDRVRNALQDFEPDRGQGRIVQNAFSRLDNLERRLGRDTSGFTNQQQRQFENNLSTNTANLTRSLENLGFDPSEFAFTGGTPAQPASLDAFFESPEFQLFGDQNSRVVGDTVNALSAAGLRDSGFGREVVTDTVSRNLGNTFNAFVNRNLGLADRGQQAAVQSGNASLGVLGQQNALSQQLGNVAAGRQLNAFGSLGNALNQGAQAVEDGFSAPGGFTFNALGNSLAGANVFG